MKRISPHFFSFVDSQIRFQVQENTGVIKAVADPAQWRIQDFLGGGGHRDTILLIFSEKLHEIEKKLVAGGGGHAPGAPPRSATAAAG